MSVIGHLYVCTENIAPVTPKLQTYIKTKLWIPLLLKIESYTWQLSLVIYTVSVGVVVYLAILHYEMY